MQQLVSHTFAILGDIWPPLVYLIVAVWVGVESAGIGLPIEPMMLFAGSLATQGKISVVLTVLITSLGCLAFAGLAYMIGRHEGTTAITRFGRFIGLNQTRADHLELWLQHRGALGIFIARVTPVVRTFGSYVMGAADISPRTFTLGSTAAAGSLRAFCSGRTTGRHWRFCRITSAAAPCSSWWRSRRRSSCCTTSRAAWGCIASPSISSATGH